MFFSLHLLMRRLSCQAASKQDMFINKQDCFCLRYFKNQSVLQTPIS